MPDAKTGGSPGRTGLSAGSRVVLLVGPELFLHAERTETLRAALTAAHGRVGVFQFDGATAEAAAVLDECRTFGLMDPHKLVIVDDTDQFLRAAATKTGEDPEEARDDGSEGDEDGESSGSSRHRELLERYVQSPCEGTTLLLRSEKGFNLGRLKGMIQAVGALIRCSLIDPDVDKGPSGRALGKEAAQRLAMSRATEWVVRRAAQPHGCTIAPDAATLLVERIGPDLSRLDSELAKLALNAERGTPITARAVAEAVGRSREEEVWVIQSALISGDAGAAVRSIRDAIDVSRHHPVLVSWACVDLARKLHGASRGLAAGMNEWQMRGPLRLWGDGATAIIEAARRLRPDEAAALLRDAIESDVRQKSGGSDPERALEVLALRFAGV